MLGAGGERERYIVKVVQKYLQILNIKKYFKNDLLFLILKGGTAGLG
jgi:hypothetical protein